MSEISIEKWRKYAHALHYGQTDHSGAPYSEHLDAVLAGVQVLGGTHEEQIAALLHDSIEDGHATPETLTSARVPEESLRIIRAVTKAPGETVDETVNKISRAGVGAIRVKLADLIHNTRHDRVALLRAADPAKSQRLLHRYQHQILVLSRHYWIEAVAQ